jgi:hypothetical protein
MNLKELMLSMFANAGVLLQSDGKGKQRDHYHGREVWIALWALNLERLILFECPRETAQKSIEDGLRKLLKERNDRILNLSPRDFQELFFSEKRGDMASHLVTVFDALSDGDAETISDLESHRLRDASEHCEEVRHLEQSLHKEADFVDALFFRRGAKRRAET